MADIITFKSNAIAVTLSITIDSPVAIRSIEPIGPEISSASAPASFSPFFSDAELPLVQARFAHKGSFLYRTSKSLIGNAIGMRLRYSSHSQNTEGASKTLSVTQVDKEAGVSTTSHITIYDGFPAIRFITALKNESGSDIVISQLSSFAIGGLTTTSKTWNEDYSLITATNTWFREAQWVEHSMASIGLDSFGIYNTTDPHRVTSLARYTVQNQGTFSTEGLLPMGLLTRANKSTANDGWLWQVEHNGAWLWEVGDFKDSVYVAAGGPVASGGHEWYHRLKPGQTFTSVPAAICRVADGGVNALFAALTQYRRHIRRAHNDLKSLPVIFNDFMNCLMGSPTEAKIKALI